MDSAYSFADPVVQEILVDRGEFVLQLRVEELDDLGIALHGRVLFVGMGKP
jgi:hypothetical protein